MADTIDVDRIDADIRARYPYPLAATFHRAYYGAAELDETHEYLFDLFEVLLKYLASITLAHYFADDLADPAIDRSLQNLERPSLGHWQGWLRDILDLYRRTRQPLLVPEIATFYAQKHGGEVLAAYSALSQLMAERMAYEGARNLSAVTTQQFFELLGVYRNKVAHGARPSRYDRERVAEILLPGLRALLWAMSFAADYRLVYVREVSVEFDPARPGQYRFAHRLTYLTGLAPGASQKPKILDASPARDKELYLLDKKADFQPLLSLHPFIIFRHCESCNREQAFVLNTSRENALDYISYQCTHHFSPTEYVDYMRTLLSNVRQRRTASDQGAVTASPAPPASTPPAPDDAAALRLAEVEAQLQQERQARQEAELRAAAEATARQASAEAERKADEENARKAKEESARKTKEAAERRRAREQARQAQEQVAADAATALPRTMPMVEGRSASLQSDAGETRPLPPLAEQQSGVTYGPNGEVINLGSAGSGITVQTDGRTIVIPPTLVQPAARRSNAGALLGVLVLLAVVGGLAWFFVLAPRGNEQIVLPHTVQVYAVAVSPDGQTIASGAGDYSIGLWRVADGKVLRQLRDLPGAVTSVSFSPDGKLLAAAAGDATVRVWNVADDSAAQTLEGHTSAVTAVAFSPDGQLLASAGADYTIKLWQVADWSLRSTIEGHSGTINALAFSPDGLLLASASDDHTVHMWRTEDGSFVLRLDGHQDSVRTVAFAPDGATIATGGADRTVRYWRTEDGTALSTVQEATAVTSVAFAPNSLPVVDSSQAPVLGANAPGATTLAVACAGDDAVRLESATDGTLLRTLSGHTGGVNALAWSPDARLLVSASDDHTVRLWATTQTNVPTIVPPLPPTARPLSTEAPLSNSLAHNLATLVGHNGSVQTMDFSPDGSLLASGGGDGTVRLWRVASGDQVQMIDLGAPVQSVDYSPDGKTVLIAGVGTTVWVWQPPNDQAAPLLDYGQAVNAAVYSPDGRNVAIGAVDNAVVLLNATTGAQIRTIAADSAVRSVAFSPDGSMVGAGTSNGGVHVWSLVDGAVIKGGAHQDAVAKVAFSPDSQYIASASQDRTAAIWHTSNDPLTVSETLGAGVSDVVFSPDGTLLALASGEASVAIFRLSSATVQRAGEVNHGQVNSVAFAPDGHIFATGSADNTIRLWELAP